MIPHSEKYEKFLQANLAGGVSRPARKSRKPILDLPEKKEDYTPKGNPEEQLTMDCYSEFIRKYPELHKRLWHTANENFVREIGGKRKAMGVLTGVPDFKLDIPAVIDGAHICGLDIELKVPGNYQQKTQKEFEDYSLATGHIYRVVKSVEDFMSLIDRYLTFVDPQIIDAIKRLNIKWKAIWEEEQTKKERRAQASECNEIARRLGIDPSRIHGMK